MSAPGRIAGLLLVLALGLIILSPVLFILWGAYTETQGESWPHVKEYLLTPALRTTVILLIGVALVSLLFGIPAAWCLSHYRFFGCRLFSVLLILPLAVPPYIAAYITTEAREAAIPWLVEIRNEQGVDAYLEAELRHRYAWLIIMMASVLYPYIFLATRSVFSNRSRQLGQAARLLGAGRWRSFRNIHLRLVRPAAVAGLFLVCMEVLSDYGAAKHFGFSTLTVVIFRTWFGLQELETARHLSGLILVGVFIVLLLEQLQRGRARFGDAHSVTNSRQRPGIPGTLLCWLACGVPVALGFLYPVYVLIQWQMDLQQEFLLADHQKEIVRTVLLTLSVALICILISLFFLTFARFTKSKTDQLLAQATSTAGYASPSTVMAVGVLGVAALSRTTFANYESLQSYLVSGSLIWLIFALASRYLAVSGQVLSAGIQTIPNRYDHSARILGRKPWMVFLTVHLPLLKAPVIAAAILVSVDIAKELPLTLLLRPFDFETLGTANYSQVNQGHLFASATPALILITICAIGLVIVEFLTRKK